MIKFEDVANVSTKEYFNDNQFSIDAFDKKYSQNVNGKKESYPQALKRVCDYIASPEKTEEERTYWAERWFDEIYNDWWHPAGSIMQGANSNRGVSLSNCTTISLGNINKNVEWDSLEGIIKNTAYTVAKTAAHRQGLGVDFSAIRPKQFVVNNSSNESQGALHWMKLIDSIGNYIGQKGRIPAMLFSLSVNHPDIEDFVKAKSDYTSIQNANISVQTNDAFYKAVEEDADWELTFTVPGVQKGQKVYIDVHSSDMSTLQDEQGYYYIAKRDRKEEKISRTVKARELLQKIAKNMATYAEPGIQQMDMARKWSNSDYVYNPDDLYDSRIQSSNAPLVGETLIPTINGIKKIKDLYEQKTATVLADTLSTLPPHLIDCNYINNKTNKKVFMSKISFPTKTFPIEAKFKKFENQQVWEIHLHDGTMQKCNGEHKWLINGEMIETKNIKIGDKLYKPNGGVAQAYSLTIDKTSKEYEEGQLIGYFVGDGWVGKESNSHNKMVGIIYDNDCEYFSKLFRKKYFEITGNILNYTRDRGKIKETRSEAKEFVEYFESFGFDEDKYNIPQRCYDDITFCAGFLNGLFQADGNVFYTDKYNHVTLTSVSHEVAYSVMSLLTNWFGITGAMCKSKSKGVPYILKTGERKISNAKDKYDVTIAKIEHVQRFSDFVDFIETSEKHRDLNIAKNNVKTKSLANRMSLNVVKVVQTESFEDMYCAVVDGIHSFVVDGLISSNCSEQYLSRDSLCVLASINAAKFDADPEVYKPELKKIGYSVNRFLDNVNEMELRGQTYATPHQKLAIEKLRRTGAGITNIAGWLFKQNLEYGSALANSGMFEFNKMYNYYLYESSIELGKEKGSFGLFVREKYEQSPFIQEMMKLGLEFEAMRNVTCSSIAPNGCIEENTRIVTNKGLIKIKDLIELEKHPQEKQFQHDLPEIYAYDENGQSKITGFYNNGIVNGYVIEFEDGRTQKISETHRIRVLKNGVYDWEYAPNLNVGDVAILAKNISKGVTEYADLKIDQTLKHHNSSDCKLPEKLDEQLAEFLGLFTGDGSIKFRSEHKTTTKPDAIRFPIFGDDEDLAQWLVKRIEDLFGVQTNVKKSLLANIWEASSHSVTVCNYLIDNEFSKKDYVSKGFHGKNHVYHIPELIFKSPKSVICAYLRGLFEADGCISNGAIAFTSKFKHMVEEVQELLTYVGIQSFIAKKENRKSSFGKNVHVLTIRFKDSCILFKENIHFLSNRKNEKLNAHSFEEDREKVYIPKENFQKYQTELSKTLTCKSKVYLNLASLKCSSKNINEYYYVLNKNIVRDLVKHTSLTMPFDLDNYFNLKIKKITREEFKTFDIEVLNDNHTYITANGVINHNTLSLMMRDFVMSYGVEPGFGIYFWKRSRMSGSYQYYFCVPHVVRQVFAEHGYPIPMESDTLLDTWDGALGKPIAKFIDENKDKIGIKFKNSTEIKALDKLDLMSKLMQYVDSSISVTYSLPHDATWEDTYNLIIEANKRGVKSIAAFPDKKMYGIVSFMPFKELAVSLKTDNIAIHPTNFNEEELKELNIIGDEVKNNTYSPKRLKELDADIHIVTASGKKYIMVIGMQRDRPYELFGGLIKDGLVFKQAQKKGKIVKIKKGMYSLEIGEEIVIENFGEYFTAIEQAFFRMVSLHLRKGTPIKEIAEQLSEASDDMVSLTAAASRVLRKYIKNGEEVVGMKCPSCGKGNLYYNGGCASCSCGWEKCS